VRRADCADSCLLGRRTLASCKRLLTSPGRKAAFLAEDFLLKPEEAPVSLKVSARLALLLCSLYLLIGLSLVKRVSQAFAIGVAELHTETLLLPGVPDLHGPVSPTRDDEPAIGRPDDDILHIVPYPANVSTAPSSVVARYGALNFHPIFLYKNFTALS
jgi:hypothetical protein